jgi:hypothetical protein
MLGGFYILNEHKTVPVSSLLEWIYWKEAMGADCRVAFDEVEGVEISTVFIGLNFSYEKPPQLFETMVFSGGVAVAGNWGYHRYATWDDAVEGHNKTVARVMTKLLEGHRQR